MALLDNIDEIKRHNSAVSGDLDLINIQSFIDSAENKHLIPTIGRAQFDALVSGKDGFEANSKEKTLLLILQKAAVNFALAYYANFGAIEISDAGIHVSKTDKRLPASDKKIMALRRQSMADGYEALELAVAFLEANIHDFEPYKLSEEHKNNRALYINASLDFPQKIRVSAELFDRIKSIQADIEEEHIDTILGATVASSLRAKILSNTLEELEKELLKRIRKALAAITLSHAIPYNLISIDPTGAYIYSDTVGGISGNVENRTPAELQRLQVTMNRLACEGESKLESLRQWLNENKASFEGYTESTASVMTQVNSDTTSNIYFM